MELGPSGSRSTMTAIDHHRPHDSLAVRAEIERTVADEMADHWSELTSLHLAHGSTLLRAYRPSQPRPSAWLDPRSRLRRWFGEPTTLLALIGSTILAFTNVFLNDVPNAVQGLAIALIIGTFFTKIVYRRFTGWTGFTAESARSRALAYADSAKDCIALGSTHVSWREHGTLFDRTRIVPLDTVTIVNQPHRIAIHDRQGRTLMVIDHPQARSAFQKHGTLAISNGSPTPRGFGRRA